LTENGHSLLTNIEHIVALCGEIFDSGESSDAESQDDKS
jgi:hypothetical protein